MILTRAVFLSLSLVSSLRCCDIGLDVSCFSVGLRSAHDYCGKYDGVMTYTLIWFSRSLVSVAQEGTAVSPGPDLYNSPDFPSTVGQ